MEDFSWMKLFSALLLGAMIIFLLPRAKQMMENSPKATGKDWQSVLFPLIFVVLFIVFLVSLV